jgi:predicted amidohydrolase
MNLQKLISKMNPDKVVKLSDTVGIVKAFATGSCNVKGFYSYTCADTGKKILVIKD